MKHVSILVPFCLVIGLFVTEVKAQDFNDEMKKNLRQSLLAPDNRTKHQQSQAHQILPGNKQEVLRVSPTTRLPTKADRIQILYPPERYLIHMNLHTTNTTPINQRPAGSVKYEFNGKNLQIISTGGEMVVPSGIEMDPIRARNRRRYERTVKLMKAYTGQ